MLKQVCFDCYLLLINYLQTIFASFYFLWIERFPSSLSHTWVYSWRGFRLFAHFVYRSVDPFGSLVLCPFWGGWVSLVPGPFWEVWPWRMRRGGYVQGVGVSGVGGYPCLPWTWDKVGKRAVRILRILSCLFT